MMFLTALLLAALAAGSGALSSGTLPSAPGGSPVTSSVRLPQAHRPASVRPAPVTLGRDMKKRPVSPSAPRAYARARLSAEQYRCLDLLWTKESHWNPHETYGRAYGIPQAVPGSKMASAGADWRTNPITQVRWGLGYIRAVYRTPCNAWAHSKAVNWY